MHLEQASDQGLKSIVYWLFTFFVCLNTFAEMHVVVTSIHISNNSQDAIMKLSDTSITVSAPMSYPLGIKQSIKFSNENMDKLPGNNNIFIAGMVAKHFTWNLVIRICNVLINTSGLKFSLADFCYFYHFTNVPLSCLFFFNECTIQLLVSFKLNSLIVDRQLEGQNCY